MKAVLRNPKAVAILALIACVVMFWQVAIPLLTGSAPEPSESGKPINTESITSGSTQPVAISPSSFTGLHEGSGMSWNEAPRRDPFGSFRGPLAAIASPDGHPGSASLPAAKTQLRLMAVVTAPNSRAATINNTIVVEGDRVDKFRVARIDPDAVWLEGPQGRERLEFPPLVSGGTKNKEKSRSVDETKSP